MTATFAPNYVGWYLDGDIPTNLTCWKDWTFFTSGSLANCHASGVPIVTGCNQVKNDEPATLLYPDGLNEICDQGLKCQTAFIMETSPTGTPVLTEYFCESTWTYPSTLYRQLPASVYVTITADSQPTPPARTPTKTESRSTPVGSSTADSAQDNSEDRARSENSGLSGGAIAGIVIGVVAAIVFAALFFLRKKILACFGKRETADPSTQPENGPTELSTQNEIHEISSSGPYAGGHFVRGYSPRGDKTVSEIGSST